MQYVSVDLFCALPTSHHGSMAVFTKGISVAPIQIVGRSLLQNARNKDKTWSPHSLPQMFQWLVMGPPRGKSVAVKQEGEEIDRQVASKEAILLGYTW